MSRVRRWFIKGVIVEKIIAKLKLISDEGSQVLITLADSWSYSTWDDLDFGWNVISVVEWKRLRHQRHDVDKAEASLLQLRVSLSNLILTLDLIEFSTLCHYQYFVRILGVIFMARLEIPLNPDCFSVNDNSWCLEWPFAFILIQKQGGVFRLLPRFSRELGWIDILSFIRFMLVYWIVNFNCIRFELVHNQQFDSDDRRCQEYDAEDWPLWLAF